MRIQVTVFGEPKAQPRPRAFKRGDRASVYNPSTAEGWKSIISMTLRDHIPEVPFDGPVSLSARFLMPRPKRLLRKNDPAGEVLHISKPDCDNLVKAVMDVCTQISVWNDDSQVVDQFTQKRYAAKDGRPGMVLIIESIEEK